MGQDGVHTYDQGAWHYCGRCDEKEKLKRMKWQNGVLLCPTCVDNFPNHFGQIERMQVEVLSDGKVEFDLDPKLKDPQLDIAADEDINIGI